ncbi:hypothetical protein ACFSWE_07180 [Leucobacter albus]|uniref:Transmembrane protein n=1 Tax=Leucobacter albus TaxID=272210 RepID=A0ABW3TK15_9MICO
MEKDPTPQEAMATLAEAEQQNIARLQRPARYWPTLGLMLAVFALLPYTRSWPMLLQYLIPPATVIAIGAVAAWKQPSAVRKLRLSGSMTLGLIGFAAAAGVLGGLSTALYAEHGWWWLPAVAAAALFALVTFGGRALDRFWARRASRGLR